MPRPNNRPTPEQAQSINDLLDEIKTDIANLKNDAALAKYLGFAPPQVSKLRHGLVGLSGDMKIRIHERAGLAISYIQQKCLAGANKE